MRVNLHIFDGEGGGEVAATNTGATVETNETVDLEAREAELDAIIKDPRYKDIYDKRVRTQLDRRFKDYDGLKKTSDRFTALQPMLDMLTSKYGVKDGDYEALMDSITEDDSFYEDAAIDAGMTVEQYKRMAQLERENAQLQQMRKAQEQQQQIDRQIADWSRQEEDARQFYPQFDLKNELNSESGERFLGLLKAGVDVKTAYETIHIGELVGGAMAHTANTVRQQTVNDIRARGMRPMENGAGNSSLGVNTKIDINKSTKAERDALAKRAMRGERVSF